LAGLPDELPITWCPNCAADVKPKGKGTCPRCGRVLKGSFIARRHPVNILRRDQILKKLVAEYRPTSTRVQAMCEHYASVLEQLESLKAGTDPHRRLVEQSLTLGRELEASRSSRPPVVDPDYDSLNDDELVSRLEDALSTARRDRDAKLAASIPALPQRVQSEPEPIAPPPTPEPQPTAQCQWCRMPAEACASLKERNLTAWQYFHRDSPDEQARLDQEHAVEFKESIARWRSGWGPQW
jgi:hypothetical protein